MKKYLLLAIIALACLCATAQTYDPYLGISGSYCSNSTGYFHPEKTSGRWTWCSPQGHGYWAKLPYYADSTTNGTYQANVNTKYSGYYSQGWLNSVTNKIKGLKFNGYADGGAGALINASTTATKLPFIRYTSSSDYSMRASGSGGHVKDLFAGTSPFYRNTYSGYISSFPDVYDPTYTTFCNAGAGDVNGQWGGNAALSVYPYEIGVTMDDADYIYGLKDAATCGGGSSVVPGNPHAHMGWFVATMAPYVVTGLENGASAVGNGYQQLYPTTTQYTKAAWITYLTSKYTTVGALNTAWGSSYTSLASTGVNTNQTLGTGTGSLQTLSGTLTGGNVGLNSVAIKVGSTVVCGDKASTKTSGTWSDTCSGTINYTTGAYSVTGTFTNGSTVSANYQKGGYGFGTGVADEDGTHTSWVGTNIITPNGSAGFNSDIDTFLYQLVKQYFYVQGSAIKAADTNHLVGTPASIGGCARDQVFQAAQDCVTSGGKQCVDYLEIGTVTMQDPAHIIKHAYDASSRPIMVWETRISNTDSDMSGSSSCSNWGIFCSSTQGARGAAAAADINALWAAQGTNGDYPVIGYKWWEWTDNTGEQTNFGLVSLKDNAYDGLETITGTIPCGYSNSAYPCGGEAANYGSGFLSAVATANQTIDNQLSGTSSSAALTTAPNTAACSGTNSAYCGFAFTGWSDNRGTFTPLTNPYDAPPLNINKGRYTSGDVHTLTTLNVPIFVHTQFWFTNNGTGTTTRDGVSYPFDGSHLKNGVTSNDQNYISTMVQDLYDRGFDGILGDWKGGTNTCASPSFNSACTGSTTVDRDGAYTKAITTMASSFPALKFALVYDASAFNGSQNCSTADADQPKCIQGKIDADLDYAATQYFAKSPYLKDGSSKPIVLFFIAESDYLSQCTSGSPCNLVSGTCTSQTGCWTSIWSGVNSHTSGAYSFVFENTGGFTHAQTAGGYAWTQPSSTQPPTNTTQLDWADGSYLDNFYTAAQSTYPSLLSFGAVYKGFDSETASWYYPNGRVIAQQCGQVWLNSFAKLNGKTNLKYAQIVTWDDYEEGTEIETGIDNCYANPSATLTGNTLFINLNPTDPVYSTTATISALNVWYSQDGTNWLLLDTLPVSNSTSINLSSYPALTAGRNYQFKVQQVGKAGIANKVSPAAVQTGSVTLSPGNYSYGSVLVGNTPSTTFTLSNTTSSSVTISSQAVTGTGFSLTSSSSTCTAGLVLTSNASCTISVLFTPAAATTYSGNLAVVLTSGTINSTFSGTGYTSTPRVGKSKGPKWKSVTVRP
jgi:hypothetical protein